MFIEITTEIERDNEILTVTVEGDFDKGEEPTWECGGQADSASITKATVAAVERGEDDIAQVHSVGDVLKLTWKESEAIRAELIDAANEEEKDAREDAKLERYLSARGL